MLDAAPQESLALVVGIDHYKYGDAWRLGGPVADALRCVDWLIERGMPTGNIALFLSTPSWTEDADVVAWVARRAWPQTRYAKRNDIASFVDDSLLDLDPDAKALFVFWGSHGVVDDFDKSNYLYTEDAKEGAPYCISASNLMLALQGRKFSRLAEQVLVVDACANAFSTTGEAASPGVIQIVPSEVDYDIRQFQAFAASPGKPAADIPERRTGRFSQALFGALRADKREGWPDFAEAFERTLDDVEGDARLAGQQPFLMTCWPGVGRRISGRPPGDSPAVASLLALIRQMAASPRMLFRLYERSLPDINRSIGDAPVEDWLRDLEDKRPREANHPSPLIQFAERLARDMHSAELSKWVEDHTHGNVVARDALRAALDAEALLRRRRAMVFMEVDAQTQRQLHWWIHAPDAAHCTTRQTLDFDISRNDQTAVHMGRITAEAERKVGHLYEPMVGIIVPDTLLAADLESLKVAFDDDGLPSDPTSLNRRYPVTLHWQTRARAPAGPAGKPINAWRQALGALKPRMAAGGGADVVWVEPAEEEDEVDPSLAAAARLLKGQGVCVGLGHPAAPVDRKTPKEIIGCLRAGVPCFFWLARAPAGTVDEARKALCELFQQQDPREAPLEIGKLLMQAKAANPLSSIRIVWDEPGHVPFISET